MKETQNSSKAASDIECSTPVENKLTSKLSSILAVRRRPRPSEISTMRQTRADTSEQSGYTDAYPATLPTGCVTPSISRYACRTQNFSTHPTVATTVSQRQHSVPSSPCCSKSIIATNMNTSSPSFRMAGTARSSPGIQNPRVGEPRYHQAMSFGSQANEALTRRNSVAVLNTAPQMETTMAYSSGDGDGFPRHALQGKTCRFPLNSCNAGTPGFTSSGNTSCIATPQIHRSNRLNTNKDYASVCRAGKTGSRSGQFSQSPSVSSASTEGERSDTEAKQTVPELAGSESAPTSYPVSEAKEINMRSLRQPQKPLSRSFCQEGRVYGRSLDHEDVRGCQSPQCTPRSSKLRLQRTSSIQPPLEGRMSLNNLGNQQENTQSANSGTLSLRRKTSTTRSNERSIKSSAFDGSRNSVTLGKSTSGSSLASKSDTGRTTSLDSQVSASSSCNSSPLTPRASWSVNDGSTCTIQGRLGAQSRCPSKNRRLQSCPGGNGLKIQPSTSISPDRPGERTAKKANRPKKLSVFNSAGVQSKRVSLGEANVSSNSQKLWDLSGESQRLTRLSSLPVETKTKDPEGDSMTRAKTMSPPPKDIQYGSLETGQKKTGADDLRKQSCRSASDSGNSSCTLGQKSGPTSPETPHIPTENASSEIPQVSLQEMSVQNSVPKTFVKPVSPAPPVSTSAPVLTVTCIADICDGPPAELTDSATATTSPSIASSLSVSGCSNRSNIMELSGILKNLPYSCEKHERKASLPSSETLLAPPSPIPRLQLPNSGGMGISKTHRNSLNTIRTADDPIYSCLGTYFASPPSPLSHIKLPYATHTPRSQSVVVPPTSSTGLEKQATLLPPVHSTSGNLVHTSTGVYVHAPERQTIRPGLTADGPFASPVARLQEELDTAKKHVAFLSCRLSANTSVVQAFEQSLHSMSARMQQIMKVSSIKDKEVKELRNLVGQLRVQLSIAIGQTSDGHRKNEKELADSSEVLKHHILGILKSNEHSNITDADSASNFLRSSSYQEMSRISADSSQQLNPFSTQESLEHLLLRNSGRLNRLKTSINRAFGRSKSRDPCDQAKNKHNITSSHQSDADGHNSRQSPSSSSAESPSTTCPNFGFDGQSVSSDDLSNLQNQLADKDLRLTDAQLESLSRFHQLQQMQTLLTSLQSEISLLREENEQLHQTVDRCSQSGGSESLGASLFAPRIHSAELLKKLFVPKSAKGSTIPVFLQFTSSPGCLVNQKQGSNAQTPFLSTPQSCQADSHSLNLSDRLPGSSTQNSRCTIQGLPGLPKLHLLGRITLSSMGNLKLLEDQVKALFQTYLQYLDLDDNLGLSADSIASLVIKYHTEVGTAQGVSGGQAPEQHVRLRDDQEAEGSEVNSFTPDHVAGIKVLLHDNAYVAGRRRTNSKDDGKHQCQPSFTVESTSAIAWISLLPCTLLQKMIESLLSNKCAIIYGPKGAGKLEFGRLLIDAMVRMFPGFWNGSPSVEYRQVARSHNVQCELRQLLTDALSIEGLLILRLSPSNLVDLLEVMVEVPFQTHPKKVLLLVITDGLNFPKELTELPNCPGIFPFLADLQSTVAYMKRCIRQRFSQYAFHFLEMEQQSLQSPPQLPNQAYAPTDFHQEFKCVADILDWLPDFWLHLVRLKRNLTGSHTDTFPVSPFRLLACPFTIQSSWTWFMELWDAEIQHGAESRASSLPPGNFSSTGGPITKSDSPRLGAFTRWMFSTWPWPELPSCINGIPLLQRSVFLPWDLTSTAAAAILGTTATGPEISSSSARRLSQTGPVSQSLSVLTKLSLKNTMCNSDLFTLTQSTGAVTGANDVYQCSASPRESCAAIYDSYSSIPALFPGHKEVITHQLLQKSQPTSTPPLASLCAAKPSNVITCHPFV